MSKLINGKMGYIQMDSHMDTAEDIAGERLNHACPVSRAAELGWIPRTWLWSASTAHSTRARSVSTSTGPDPDDHHLGHRQWGIDKTVERILDIAWDGTDGVVLHTDLDVWIRASPRASPPRRPADSPRAR